LNNEDGVTPLLVLDENGVHAEQAELNRVVVVGVSKLLGNARPQSRSLKASQKRVSKKKQNAKHRGWRAPPQYHAAALPCHGTGRV